MKTDAAAALPQEAGEQKDRPTKVLWPLPVGWALMMTTADMHGVALAGAVETAHLAQLNAMVGLVTLGVLALFIHGLRRGRNIVDRLVYGLSVLALVYLAGCMLFGKALGGRIWAC